MIFLLLFNMLSKGLNQTQTTVIVADNQALTRNGILHLIERQLPDTLLLEAANKESLIKLLLIHPDSLVWLDYTLFDFNQAQELINLCARFSKAHIILLSADLSLAFIKQITLNTTNTSLIFKSSSQNTLLEAFHAAIQSKRYLCIHTQELLAIPEQNKEHSPLSKTEEEILKLIALGKSSKEIANLRHLSQHTVVTHRKNIFRKLEVNTIYEATRKAMRMGLANAVDYEI